MSDICKITLIRVQLVGNLVFNKREMKDLVHINDWEKIYIAFERLAETIWDWMYSGEEVRRHIMQQADNLKDLLDISYLKKIIR